MTVKHAQINIPADFDTIKKAIFWFKTTEDGIKQGLSRSNADFKSPCFLYSIMDFYCSKAIFHRRL